MYFNNIYNKRKVFLTGHTGFKGSWLALWLKELGADVTGYALDPEKTPNHWELLQSPLLDLRADINDYPRLKQSITEASPEIVFHLAAQPLVRRSYKDPINTWLTNVVGTVNLLEACRLTESVRAIVVVTTDKCYKNREWDWGYRENDELGGYDPYSASKAGSELVVSSYRNSYFKEKGVLIASARAGNVIGGGDWSEDRLIPDIIRAFEKKDVLEIRSPKATRPWQHVLEPLSGYLLLGQKLLEQSNYYADAWNFGPTEDGNRSVSDVLEKMKLYLPAFQWEISKSSNPHEAQLLYLDISKARINLGWQPIWDFDLAIRKTAEWYKSYISNSEIKSREQLHDYLKAGENQGVAWCKN